MTLPEFLGLLAELVGNILSVILILALLSGKKEAKATLGWLLLVLIFPYVGAIAYFLFGRPAPPFPARKSAFGAKYGKTAPEALPEPVARAARLTGIGPIRCRNLEFLAGAELKYPRLLADIEAAQRRIVLSYYVFSRDATGKRFLAALARKAREGVDVRLLYDGWGAIWLNFGKFLGPYRNAGVDARPFHPVADPLQMSRVNFRNHRKIAVIDGRIGYTGSINIGDEYLGRHARFGSWRDVHVRLEGAPPWPWRRFFGRTGRWQRGKGLSRARYLRTRETRGSTSFRPGPIRHRRGSSPSCSLSSPRRAPAWIS
jgi:cardiolipin synthase